MINNNELYVNIGNILREARLEKEMTLEQLAEKVNVTPKTIQRYETGERKISIQTLHTITNVLDIDKQKIINEIFKCDKK